MSHAGRDRRPEVELAAVAARQHGLFTYAQALDAGMTRAQLSRWAAVGRVERVERRLYRLPATQMTWTRQVMAACLVSGGVASHRTAAAMLQLDGAARSCVEITMGSRRRYPDRIVHESRIRPGEVTVVEDIPCTTATRTIIDLGAVVADRAVERAMECAIRRGLTTEPYVRRGLARLPANHPGSAAARRVLERRRGHPATGSDLETLFLQLVRWARLPEPVRQYPVGRYRVDFAWPERRLAVELDGLGAHATGGALRRDLSRQNDIVLFRWTLLRFTWVDVTEHPERILTALSHQEEEPAWGCSTARWRS